MIIYNKLVRNNIPKIIKDSGKVPITRILSDNEFKEELKKKLVEEANEVLNSKSEDELVKEIVDVQTLLNLMKKTFNVSEDMVAAGVIDKILSNGNYTNKIFLIGVEENETETNRD